MPDASPLLTYNYTGFLLVTAFILGIGLAWWLIQPEPEE